jgi:hypothetical protein
LLMAPPGGLGLKYLFPNFRGYFFQLPFLPIFLPIFFPSFQISILIIFIQFSMENFRLIFLLSYF